ncbi:MAG: hypothetical protein LBS92_07560 [Candidatus Methanoplasma sp.]|jgi:hypothetical protein|nr:hypothetical protein [Candidatus Methanoplasma sp.]
MAASAAAPFSSAESYRAFFDDTEEIWVTQGTSDENIVEFIVHSGVYDLSDLDPWFYRADAEGNSDTAEYNRLQFPRVSTLPFGDAVKFIVLDVNFDFKVVFANLKNVDGEHDASDPALQPEVESEGAAPNTAAVVMAIAVIISVSALLLCLMTRRNVSGTTWPEERLR